MIDTRTDSPPSNGVPFRKPWTAFLSKISERDFVLILCFLAAIHVLIYCAAFPFFNDVDEEYHFDLVLKYSHGLVPGKLDPLSAETANYITLYGTYEYLNPFQESLYPMWMAPRQEQAAAISRKLMAYSKSPVSNFEASQPPLYYTVAALWLILGKTFGVAGGFLLYWIRFLNVFLAALLVWLGYVAARLVFPEDRFVRLGVPILLSVLPQDMFYSIQNDLLSPLCFGIVFILLVRWLRADVPDAKLGFCTGLSLAALCLVKVSNLPLLAVAFIAVLVQSWRLAERGKLRKAFPSLISLVLSEGLPIACLVAWNLHHYGDLTGSAPKMAYFGWTRKPVVEWLNHPIFTPSGFWSFWTELIASFWRGEFLWGFRRMALPSADVFYAISSAVLVTAAAIGMFSRFAPTAKPQRQAIWLSLCSFAAPIAYLALLSTIFDFGRCFSPSRAFPYFTAGRLISGALIPFFLVYLYGLEWTAKRLKVEGYLWYILAIIVVFVAGSQIASDSIAFSSRWNWFHMIMG